MISDRVKLNVCLIDFENKIVKAYGIQSLLHLYKFEDIA